MCVREKKELVKINRTLGVLHNGFDLKKLSLLTIKDVIELSDKKEDLIKKIGADACS